MKKKMYLTRIMSMLAVISMIFSCMAISVSAGAASDAKKSVVAVIDSDMEGYGTGFAIGEVGKPVEFIVTNNHVVKGDQGKTTAMVAFDLASNEMVTANIYFYDAEKDIAVLKLPQLTDKREAMILCPMDCVDPDDEFAALGYPADKATDWPKYNTDDITVTKGGIKKYDRVEGLDVYKLDLAITFGNSGGPLVNSNGEVVAINTFGAYGENYAIAIDELLKVLDTDRIPVTVHGDINWFLLMIIALGVIIIALVIVLVVRKNNGKNLPPSGPTGGRVTNDVNITDAKQPPAANAPGARVIAVGGTLNGKRFNVTGTVKIGRDSSQCAIAFPVSTQGVSGVHCEISFNGSVCYIKDLNSSYGTFTMDGRKLNPNEAQILRSGDKFYLASPANTFEVRF